MVSIRSIRFAPAATHPSRVSTKRTNCGNQKVVLLTGLIASGKSSFARLLKQKGFKIIDTDSITASLYEEKTISALIIKTFLDYDILTGDKIDKAKLGQVVFQNPHLLKKLTAILREPGMAKLSQKLEALRIEGKRMVVITTAYGLELGLPEMCDEVWFIDTPQRIALPAFLSRDTANSSSRYEQIRAMQPSRAELLRVANRVFRNNQGVEKLSFWADQIAKEY